MTKEDKKKITKSNFIKSNIYFIIFIISVIIAIVFITLTFTCLKDYSNFSTNQNQTKTNTQDLSNNEVDLPWIMHAGKKLYLQPSGSNKTDGSGTSDKSFSWEDAKKYCKELGSQNAHGYDDWYLPTIDQWSSIYFYEARDSYLDRDMHGLKASLENNKDFLPLKSDNYWSSSSYGPPFGYYIYTFCGTMTGHYKTEKYYARCVRDP